MPIYIEFDYNANINWAIVGQPQGGKLKVLKSFFVKYERKIPKFIDDFCRMAPMLSIRDVSVVRSSLSTFQYVCDPCFK